jgi:hypothetical protein
VEPRGRSAEVELFGDGDEVPEVAQFHLTYKVSRLTKDVLDCRPRIGFIIGDHVPQEKQRGRMDTLGRNAGGRA